MCNGVHVCLCKCVFMLHFHCSQNPNCATDDTQPSGEVVASPQLMQVSGSNIAAMGGSVVRGFHFFMVALQNGTVLQVSGLCGCTYVCMVEWSDRDCSESIMLPSSYPQFKLYYVVATYRHIPVFHLSQM